MYDWRKLTIVNANLFTADQILAGTKDMVSIVQWSGLNTIPTIETESKLQFNAHGFASIMLYYISPPSDMFEIYEVILLSCKL